MLTREMLEKMTDQERGALLDTLAAKFYKTDRFGPQLAEDFGVGLATVYRWKNGGVPWAALYALDAWTANLRREHKQLQAAARTATDALLKVLEP